MPAYRSHSIQSSSSAVSMTITKPVGLEVGDLMVQFFTDYYAHTINLLAGWTCLYDHLEMPNSYHSSIYYKIADADDVAADSFTWTFTDALIYLASLVAFSGVNTTTPINAKNYIISATSTVNVGTNTITPAANCLLCFFIAVANDYNCSGYAIAVSDPDWTEQYDEVFNSTYDFGIALATGDRPESTNTGAGTAAVATAAYNIGFLLALGEPSTGGKPHIPHCGPRRKRVDFFPTLKLKLGS